MELLALQGEKNADNDTEGSTLAARWQAGDATAFDDLVAAYQTRVARLAQRLLGWNDEVDDVVQEVFVAAYHHWNRFRGDAKLSTWLLTLTVNQCRSFQRKKWLRERLARAAQLLWGSSRGQGQPLEGIVALEQAEQSERVRHALRQLPTVYREVIVLRYFENMTPVELARTLKARINTVEVRLHRARELLRKLLGNKELE